MSISQKRAALRASLFTLLALSGSAVATTELTPATVTITPAAIITPARTTQKIAVYRYEQKNGVVSYSDIAPTESKYQLLQFELCFACDPQSKIDWRRTGLFVDRYQEVIEAAARNYGVDAALVRALIHAESAFNPNARSRKGAMGLMQLMPETARELGVGDPYRIEQNIFGGTKYLAQLLSRYRGDITLATAAYNAGCGAVERYGGIPPYAETKAYVSRVALLHQRYRQQSPKPASL